ncbi:outer membrane protein OmpW [Ferrimonas pelagia]|uniref:Outer membrane protein OmpW n=1 Tax=Ferrimonas pelagia TaxID=1177826 RepID=A0ABP9EF94_9GAMM
MKLRLLSAALLAACALPALAHQAGDIIVRAGSATVAPDESSQNVVTPDLDDLGQFSVGNNTQLGLNFTYMATDNIGIELLAATPFSHDVSVADIEIAKVKHLPPTLMAQYYFGDSGSQLRPYIGAGLNVTIFFDEKITNDVDGRLSNLDLDTSVGWAAQAGLDYQLNDTWLLNASVWYIDIGTDVNFDYTPNGIGGSVPVTIKTDIDPWVYMLSVGYKF